MIFPKKISSTMTPFLFSTEQMRTDANRFLIIHKLMRRLSFICRVQRIPVASLPFQTLLGNRTFDITGCEKWPEVRCQKPAKLEITDKLEDGQRFYTHKLTFRSSDEELDMHGTYTYLVTDLDGRRYLIGVGGRPFPIINMSDVHPDSLSSSTMVEYTVQWGYWRMAPRIA